MSYLRNLGRALIGKPYIKQVTVIEYKWKDHVVYQKDMTGLIKRDLASLQRFMAHKKFKVGDSLELVAYKAGQQDLYELIRTKMVEPRTRTLP